MLKKIFKREKNLKLSELVENKKIINQVKYDTTEDTNQDNNKENKKATK